MPYLGLVHISNTQIEYGSCHTGFLILTFFYSNLLNQLGFSDLTTSSSLVFFHSVNLVVTVQPITQQISLYFQSLLSKMPQIPLHFLLFWAFSTHFYLS